MVWLYYRIIVSHWKTFGFGTSFLGFLFLLPAFFLFTKVTLFLDRIFFHRYLKAKVENPVFLMGGRSGTTFVHRLLSETRDFPVFEAWELFFPALTARILMKPIIQRKVKNKRDIIYTEDTGHPLTITTVEEEELLFFHKIDTQFVTSRTPLGFDDIEYPELRFYDHQPEPRRKSSVKFFRKCLQRQIYHTGKTQVVAKINYSVCRMKTLMEEFPDAKFIFFLRSPYEVISSHLSQHRKMLDFHFGLENIPKDKLDRYFKRRYRYDVELYYYGYQMLQSGEIPEDRILLVQYDDLLSKLEPTFEKIIEFTGIKPTPQLREVIQRQAQKQKSFKRKHENSPLEEFGLAQEQVAQDLSIYFEEHGFTRKGWSGS